MDRFKIGSKCDSITANDVQRTERDEGEDIQIFSNIRVQFFNKNVALLVENVQEIFKDFEVESRRQHFPSLLPFTSCHKKQLYE